MKAGQPEFEVYALRNPRDLSRTIGYAILDSLGREAARFLLTSDKQQAAALQRAERHCDELNWLHDMTGHLVDTGELPPSNVH